MDLTIPAKYKDLNMSIWEKIFVSNFYKSKPIPNKTTGKSKVDLIREDINKALEELYSYGDGEHDDYFTIKSDCEAVEREYRNNIIALEGRGENIDLLASQDIEEQLKFIAGEHSRQNCQQYKYIVEIVKNELYDPAFKYLILNEALTRIYKKEPDKNGKMQTINKPRDITKSTEEFLTLNRTIMNHIYETVENNKDGDVLKNSKGKTLSFADLYFEALDDYTNTVSKKNTISLEGVETYGKGSWIKFEGKTSNPDKYIENATELAALVQGTPWCTKTLAFQQLNEGDFFVFVDNDKLPHVAVKMLGDKLDEVRGIKGGEAQELEENYRDVTISFLEKNKDIKNGREWLEKEEWNQRLVNYGKKLEAKEFTADDVKQLIQDLFFRSDYRNHTGHINTNLAKLRSKLYMGRKQFAEYFECEEDEIFCGDLHVFNNGRRECWSGDPFFNGKINKQLKIVLGNADFSSNTSIENIKEIYGKAYFYCLDELPVIQNIYARGAALADYNARHVVQVGLCNLSSLKNLKQFQGEILIKDSTIETLEHPCLTRLEFDRSSTKSFGNISKLNRLYIYESKIDDFGNLSSVDEFTIKGRCEIDNLGKIEEVGYLRISGVNHIHSFINLKKVDMLELYCENLMTSLGSLRHANYISLSSFSIKDTGDLEFVKVLRLNGNNIKKLGKTRVTTLDLSNTDGIIDLSEIEYLGEVKFPPDRENDRPGDIIHGSTTIKVDGNPQQMEAVQARINRHKEIKAKNEQKDAAKQFGDFDLDFINPELIGEITLSEQKNTNVKKRIADFIAAGMRKVREFKNKIGR